jgi:hypothetical protein
VRRDELQSPPLHVDLVLRSPVNWTIVSFLALFAGLHLGIAITAFSRGRWEGYLSLALGVALAIAAAVVARVRSEIHIRPAERRVLVRTGLRRLRIEQSVPFDDIRGIRLTLLPGGATEARIGILCDNADVECPPTTIPRQEALLLAMMMNVPLIHVSSSTASRTHGLV